MSHREGRDSDSRHHRSRFDRELSPKRVRRDGRTATEQPAINHNLDSSEHINRDKKRPVVPDSKIQNVSSIKESDKKSNGYHEGTKISSENMESSRSRSHFQHDERGRSFRHRDTHTTERGGWKDSKDRESGRATNRSSNNGSDTKKKRPSFRETKIPLDAVTHDKPATQVSKPLEGSERKEDGGKPVVERPDRWLSGERDPQRMKFQSRDRYGGGGGGGGYRGRGDRLGGGRQGQGGGGGGGAEKWKHDLYDEANKSPNSKNEEDQIAKVEALLAS
ncbi:heat shock 70 kDa protein [Lactuca sativa]|uniref:Btz domain-containing protein n=1 Tax=Lactuca sativa TaxID=4236 RepID=A0A9R1VG34_LACSA|nr:heat shock 70 kDa protein [Lactuca sativa]KAJ0204086.1 hypothetical protein LSAT_V11C500269490 [Lactuca sativa]